VWRLVTTHQPRASFVGGAIVGARRCSETADHGLDRQSDPERYERIRGNNTTSSAYSLNVRRLLKPRLIPGAQRLGFRRPIQMDGCR
jgi:hypothetical protein